MFTLSWEILLWKDVTRCSKDKYYVLKLHLVAKDSLQTSDCISQIKLKVSPYPLVLNNHSCLNKLLGIFCTVQCGPTHKKKNRINTEMRKFDFTMFPFFQSISVENEALKRVSMGFTVICKTSQKISLWA